MNPQLVLTEDDKKRRFKKFLQKKEEEASALAVTPEPRQSDEEHAYDVGGDLPPLEPIKSRASFPYPSVLPYNFSSSFYNQPWSHNKEMNNERRDSQERLQYLKAESPLMSSHSFATTSEAYCNPISSRASEKLSIPTPPSSPEESLSLLFDKEYKDVEALHYFAKKGFLPRDIFPFPTLNSPNNMRQFSVMPNKAELFLKSEHPIIKKELPIDQHQITEAKVDKQLDDPTPIDLSKSRVDQRPSVITSFNLNGLRNKSVTDEEQIDSKIKFETFNRTLELDVADENLETQPISSNKVYPSTFATSTRNENNNTSLKTNEALIFKYVHKKFRTHAEVPEKQQENICDNNPQKRKSVIFHASKSKKLCIE